MGAWGKEKKQGIERQREPLAVTLHLTLNLEARWCGIPIGIERGGPPLATTLRRTYAGSCGRIP